MEIALSAFLGEIASRSISFFTGKLSKDKAEAPYSLPSDEDLRRKLLRIRIIVQEAERRQIRSQAMLEQLKILQAGMYRGHYVLDASKYDQQAHHQDKDDTVSHDSFAISKFNPAKRIRIQLCTSSGRSSSQAGEKRLRQVLGSLELIVTDATELVVFLKICPPLHSRCLYTTYLNLENCMFDRHVEMEHVVNFLLARRYSPAGCTEDHHPDVLPIVGPGKSGKTTLIEYVCNDERVRRAFSRIVFFAEDDLDESVTTFSVRGGGGTVKYQRHGSKRGETVLVVVRVNGDISEAAWKRLMTLCSASKTTRYATTNGVTKIIICSRSNKILRFGTTGPLKVGFLTREAYWYFFKALAFGSMDPEEEPELGSLAMEIATCLKGSFIAGNALARMLRDNLSAEFWRKVLSFLKELNQKYPFMFEEHPVISPSQDRKLVPRLNGSKEYCTIFNGYQIVSAQDEVPVINFPDVLLGRALLRGKFDVLAWRSTIPPYCSYILSCEIHVVS